MSKESSFFEKVTEGVTVEIVSSFLKWMVIIFIPLLSWYFWSFLSLKITIPIYSLLVSLILGIAIVYLIKLGNDYFQKSYKDYRKDEFFGLVWKWDYEQNKKEVDLDSLTPICPKCNSTMTIYDTTDMLFREDEVIETSLLCKNQQCVYRSVVNKELQYYGGEKWLLYDEIITKIDKILRDKKLKL